MTATNNTIDPHRLATAMRRKFGSVKNLLRALGLDEKFLTTRLALDEEVVQAAPSEADKSWRLKVEEVLNEADVPPHVLKKVLALLDEKHSLSGDQEPEGEMQELRRREEHGEEAVDTEEFARFLRGKGVDAETIEGALSTLPANAIRGGMGGRLSDKRVGMDARLAKKFPGIENIQSFGGATDRSVDRRREPAAPSAARLRAMFDRFPGMREIGVHGGS